MPDIPTPVLPPFKSVHYAGRAPGTRLIVLGAVHGNETCGTRAIECVLAELGRGELALAAGSVTFVPASNPQAYAHGRRTGERNLNRALQSTPMPRLLRGRNGSIRRGPAGGSPDARMLRSGQRRGESTAANGELPAFRHVRDARAPESRYAPRTSESSRVNIATILSIK